MAEMRVPGRPIQSTIIVERLRSGVVRLTLNVTSALKEPARLAFDYAETALVSEAGIRYRVVGDEARTSAAGSFTLLLPAGTTRSHWVEFAVPDDISGGFTVTFGTPSDRDAIALPPIEVRIPR
jgi:hypothetical protein